MVDNRCDEARLGYGSDSGFLSSSVEVDKASQERWCLHLCMLSFGVVDSLMVGPSDDGFTLHIGILPPGNTSVTRGTYHIADNAINVSLVRRELEYWTWFFLRYLDDFPAVHIDVELDPVDGVGQTLDLVLGVGASEGYA